MKSVPVSKFKANCRELLERVSRTGRPLLITRRGVPIAQIVAPPHPASPITGFGVMAGTVVEHDDILALPDRLEWEALG